MVNTPTEEAAWHAAAAERILANGANSRELAQKCLDESFYAQGEERFKLRRLACEHFLRSGDTQRGEALLAQMLMEVGVPGPGRLLPTARPRHTVLEHMFAARIEPMLKIVLRNPKNFSRKAVRQRVDNARNGLDFVHAHVLEQLLPALIWISDAADSLESEEMAAEGLRRQVLTAVARWRPVRILATVAQRLVAERDGDSEQRSAQEALLKRARVCYTGVIGLSVVAPFQATLLQCSHFQFAIWSGNRQYIARAAALHAMFLASLGHSGRASSLLQLSERALSGCEQSIPKETFLLYSGRALAEYFSGNLEKGRKAAESALLFANRNRISSLQEVRFTEMLWVIMLFFLGELRQLRTVVLERYHQSVEQDDWGSQLMFCTSLSNVAWLVDDRADEATSVVTKLQERIPQTKYYNPLWYYSALAQAALYNGNGAHAIEYFKRCREGLKQNAGGLSASRWSVPAFSSLPAVDLIYHHCLGRAELLVAESCQDIDQRRQYLSQVSQKIDLLMTASRERGGEYRWARGLALLLDAGCASVSGRRGEAARTLAAACAVCRSYGMLGFAAAGGWWLADNGERLNAEQFFEEQGVVAPAAFASMLVPGFSTGNNISDQATAH